MTTDDLPCPHGRKSWRYCPHCLGAAFDNFDDHAPTTAEWQAALHVCSKYGVALESDQELAAFTRDILVAARKARLSHE